MRPDELTQAQYLLPAPLWERAVALRHHLWRSRCEHCRQISDELELAVLAARYDELRSAEHLLQHAETLAARHGDCRPEPHRPHTPGRCRPHTSAFRGMVGGWPGDGADLVAATDASWKDKAAGIAYVVSDGHFGLRGWPRTTLDPTGPSRVLINELRAVEFLLAGPAGRAPRLTVLVDSLAALTYLQRWRAGDTTAMPAGYSLRPRTQGRPPSLVRLAERLPHLPGVSFRHVKGHNGHLLNAAADALSSMARRRVRERFDLRARAHDLVHAFLRDWHATSAPTRA